MIAIIGKFKKMWDEEYIAQGFEHIGQDVTRIDQLQHPNDIALTILDKKPQVINVPEPL